ncbi:MAG TPA: GNAT family N-acetyltransferase [Longimicrobiales bacterium]
MSQTEELVIEPARPGDDEWCAQVMVATDPWRALGRSLERCRASVNRPGGELYLARRGERGERGGQPLGFIVLHATGMAGQPYVALVAVAAEARGAGVGAGLLAFAEARYPDARHIFLCVTNINEGARRLYERVGYRKVGEIPDFSGPGFSELIMHKRLA